MNRAALTTMLAACLAAACGRPMSASDLRVALEPVPPGSQQTHATVRVTAGTALPDVYRLVSHATLGSSNATTTLPDTPTNAPVTLPTTYTVAAGNREGRLVLVVDALGQDGAVVARGSAEAVLVRWEGISMEVVLSRTCSVAADCSDGVTCNGEELCTEGICAAGTPPCAPSLHPCATISCTEPATCVAQLNNALCAPGEHCDRSEGCVPGQPGAPSLVTSRVEPATVSAGGTVSAFLDVSEPLQADPTVHVDLAGARADMTVVEAGTDRGALRYRLELAINGGEPEGTHAVLARLVDMQGNAADALPVGTVRVDFTPPSATLLQAPAPAFLRDGTQAVMRVAFSEPLSAVPEVRGRRQDVVHAWTVTAGADPDVDGYRGEVTADVTWEEGAWQVEVAASDVAGNRMPWRTVAELHVDRTPPALQPGIPPSILPGRARVGQVLSVQATLTEPAATRPVLVLVSDLDGTDVATLEGVEAVASVPTFVGEAPAVDGAYRVEMRNVVDMAGNTTAVLPLGPLVVDATPPVVTVISLQPTVANAASTVVVEFSTAEPLQGFPVVALGALSMTVTPLPGGTWRAELPVAGTDLVGMQAVTISVVDLVGLATKLNAGAVDVDAVAPALLGVEFSPASARLGQVAVLSVTASEPLDGPPALAWDMPGNPGFMFAARAGQAWLHDLDVDAMVASGAYALASVTLRDLAGNTSTLMLQPRAVFTVDTQPPVIQGAAALRTRLSANPGFRGVTVDVDTDGADTVSATLAGSALACARDEATPGRFRCTMDVTLQTPAGRHVIQVRAQDTAGNAAFASVVVEVDHDPPRVVAGGTRISLDAPRGCPLTAVQRVAPGVRVQVAYVVTESLGDTPVLVAERAAGEVPLAWSEARGAEQVHAMTWPTGTAAGSHALRVLLVDDVGNQAESTLEPSLAVAGAPPALPSWNAGQVILQREPHGSMEAGALPRMRVVFDGVVGEPGTRLVAWDRGDPVSGLVLGQSPVAADGSAPPLVLNPSDRVDVFLALVDDACQLSTGTLQRVTHGLYTASLADLRPGNPTSNPHRALDWPLSGNTLPGVMPGVTVRERGTELALVDDVPVDLSAGDLSHLQLHPLHLPPLEDHAMAYDVARDRLVVMGGCSTTAWSGPGSTCNTALPFTWEFGPGGWEGVVPLDLEGDGNPMPRNHAVAVYAPDRASILMWGGQLHSGVSSNELWEWRDRSWSLQFPEDPEGDGNPAPAANAQLAYDVDRRVLVLFGGCDSGSFVCSDNGARGETWEWNGRSWKRVATQSTTPVPPRTHMGSMVYDATRRVVVMTGGRAVATGGTNTNSAAVWTWNGSAWTHVPVSGGPGAHRSHKLVHDAAGGRVLLWGGTDGSNTVRRNIYAFNGTGWTSVLANAGPSGRVGEAAAWDPIRGELVVVAGGGFSLPLRDQWRWSPTAAWRELPVQNPANLPEATPIMQAEAGMDTVATRWVRFGGIRSSTWVNETWSFAAGAWARIAETPGPNGLPTARRYPVLFTDADMGGLLMVGGEANPSITCDVSANLCSRPWLLQGGTWSLVTPSSGPALPSSSRMLAAYDPVRHRTVVRAQSTTPGSPGRTFEIDGATRAFVERTDVDSGPEAPLGMGRGMTWDPDAQAVVMWGDTVSGTTGSSRAGLWQLDGTGWHQRWLAPADAPAGTVPPYPASLFTMLTFHPERRTLWVLVRSVIAQQVNATVPWEFTGTGWRFLDLGDPEGDGEHDANLYAAAWNTDRGQWVVHSGRKLVEGVSVDAPGTWAWVDQSAGLPGVVFQADLGPVVEDARELTGITVRGVAGGTGGARVLVHAPSGWRTWGTIPADASAPAAFQVDAPPSEALNRLPLRGRIHVAIVAAGPVTMGRGRVKVDALEVDVAYTRP